MDRPVSDAHTYPGELHGHIVGGHLVVQVVADTKLTRGVRTKQRALREALGEICRGCPPMRWRSRKSRQISVNEWVEIDDLTSPGGKARLMTKIRKPTGPTVNFLLLRSAWWRVQMTINGEIVDEDAFVTPTLDGLIGAGAAVLWERRNLLRQCALRLPAK